MPESKGGIAVGVSETFTFPCSYAQQRLWFLDQIEPGSPLYNLPAAIRLKGQLDPEALEKSLQEVVRRHETLRTVFGYVNGEAVQIIHPNARGALQIVDLREICPNEHEQQVRQIASDEARQPFNLEQGPLFRVKLLRLRELEHVLLLTMHHIISDGWSIGVLIREVSVLYNALLQDRPSPLPELPIQYVDYVMWQRGWLQGEVLEKQLEYWSRQLAGVEVLELPTDRPRPPVMGHGGASVAVILPAELVRKLRRLSQGEGVTLFMTLLAGFQILLARYSGQQDIAVGTPHAGRRQSEVESLIGFFINTLVLRGDLSGDPTIGELLQRTRQRALDAYHHQDLPFEKLVERLQPQRSLSHTPLFQTWFALQNLPAESIQSAGLELEPLAMEDATAKFELMLMLQERGEGLQGALKYRAELYEAETMERMAAHLVAVLEQMAEDGQRRISQIGLLSGEEKQKLLVEWNRKAVSCAGGDRCVHELIEEQVERSPEAVAVVCGAEKLTYGELNRRANQLGHYLRRHGVVQESRVGLYLERSVEMMVGLLGILKAGGAYVPMDPLFPPERLSYMLANAGAAVVVSESRLLEQMPECEAQVICLDRERDEIVRESEENPESGTGAENLVYVIYTSGSTGQPKGVMIEHGSLVNILGSVAEHLELSGGETMLATTTISFDIAALELFTPLMTGGRLAIASTGKGELEQLAEQARGVGATVLQGTPTMWKLVMNQEWGELRGRLKILCGGEALEGTLGQRLLELSPRLWNVYGPTETTVWSSIYGVEKVGEGVVPIGRPLANTELYVLDEGMEPVPVGVAGELYIGGAGVARGYWKRGDLTGEKFVPHRFGEAGARLYRTGDRVRYLKDGNIEFLGRGDQQVKIRGYRIELGEIEAALTECAGVKQAAVVVREERGGEKRLVGYVVAEAEVNRAGLRSELKKRLPEYMVPGVILQLEAMPQTPNGKVNRRALPAAGVEQSGGEGGYVAPRTVVEELLAQIWGEILRMERVGAQDDFFALGGHSLLATQMIARVEKQLQIQLPLRKLFEKPVLAELAQAAEQLMNEDTGEHVPAIVRTGRDQVIPLSYAQQRLWLVNQLSPDDVSYNIPGGVRIQGQLDFAALERSLREIVRRHESLRTRFVVMQGEPRQIIEETSGIEMPILDVSSVRHEEREAEARRVALEDVRRPFDLVRGPLLRARLLRLSEEDHVLVVNMHHIVSDALSMGILAHEFSELYAAFSSGQPSPLPELPVQYADFSVWQRGWLQGEVLEKQLEYWRKQLAVLEPLELPTDHPRPKGSRHEGALEKTRFSPELTAHLRQLGRQRGTTLFMTMLAAFHALMYRYTRQENIAVGTPIAGRRNKELEGLIGCFINVLVLKTELSMDLSFSTLLRNVKEVTLGAYAHQDVSFDKLVEEFQPERDLSRSPLFQVMFGMQNPAQLGVDLGGIKLSQFSVDSGASKFDLLFTVIESPSGMSGVMQYDRELFEASTIVRMLQHFQTLLSEIVAKPDQSIVGVPLLSAREREELLEGWSEAGEEFVGEETVVEMFEKWVERRREETALVYEGERLSYGEVNGRANQLAGYLRKQGVGAESRVGLLLERGIEAVVGMLGVMKAGGAYVALDPGYPVERIEYMLEDAGAELVLSSVEQGKKLSEWLKGRESKEGNEEKGEKEEKAGQGLRIVCVDGEEEKKAMERESRENSGKISGGENLAYVIYTSGSTGKPKGVGIEQRQLVNYVKGVRERLGLEAGSSYAVVSTLGADLGNTVIYGGLLSGGVLHVISGERAMDGGRMGEYFEREGIDCLKIVPSHLVGLQKGGGGRKVLPRKVLVVGGEASQWRWAEEWKEEGVRVINHYGPTETTVGVLTYEVEEGEAGEQRGQAGVVPLGRPLANSQAYVLDEEMELTPKGVWGELYIGGKGVGRGYMGKAEQTAERFVPNPFSGEGREGREAGERMYRTGDRVRHVGGGKLEFLGRVDEQVKIRGYRIELGEVEEALRESGAGVEEAVVVVREEEGGEKRLVGYVVGGGESGGLKVNEIKERMRKRVPEYMVPGVIVELERMPLTANGKIDRKGLAEAEKGAEGGRGRGSEEEGSGKRKAAENEVEEVLCGIWEEVLGIEGVGVEENFFELGGDSILSIQVVARAREEGLQVTPKQMFEQQTVAGLARVAERVKKAGAVGGVGVGVEGEQEGQGEQRTGNQELGPIQAAFFEWKLEKAEHYNQAVMLELKEGVRSEWVEEVVEGMVEHHEGLRSRFERVESGAEAEVGAGGAGRWRQVVMDKAGEGLYRRCDLSSLEEEEQKRELEREVEQVQGSLKLESGELVRAVEFNLGEQGRVLLLVVHHLVVDGVSWRILLSDLERGYRQRERGEEVRLGERSSSYGRWTAGLAEYSRRAEVEQEAEYWKEQGKRVKGVPRDYEGVEEEENRVGTQNSVAVWLEEEETRELLQEVPGVYHTQINDVLLTALARVLGEWTGRGEVAVEMEGHGREEELVGVEVSRTVGWFTSLYPVVLEVEGIAGAGAVRNANEHANEHGNGNGQANSNGNGHRHANGNGNGNGNGHGHGKGEGNGFHGIFAGNGPGGNSGFAGDPAPAGPRWDVGRELKSIKEQLRRVPGRGLGYGVLRYLGEEKTRRELGEMAGAEVRFNYLGQFDQVLRESELFHARGGAGETVAKENRQRYVIDVSGNVSGGRLRMSWSYSERLHREETIRRLAERYQECLREILEHCRREEAGGHTPSDFPLVVVEQEEVERWEKQGEIEDVYSLSPMQQGMLFHGLYAPESGAYFNQMACRIQGRVEVEAFARAWEEVIRRHSVLRSSMEWEGRSEAVQVVWKEVKLPLQEQDWRGMGEGEQWVRWQEYLEQERERGFDFGQAPLQRLALVRTGEESYYFAWSNHHILFDGWSRQRVMKEVLKEYAELSRGGEEKKGKEKEKEKKERGRRGGKYRDYIAWLKKQEEKKAEKFWREELKGFRAPTRLWIERERKEEREEETGELSLRLDEAASREVEELARAQQVTVNTVVQGAWGWLLSRYSGEQDVVFGATVSGRGAGVAGMEEMVGLFINTLPVRVEVRGSEEVGRYLKRLQERQVEAREYEWSPLLRVQGWSEVERGRGLFNTLMVFENYPMEAAAGEGGQGTGLKIDQVSGQDRTHYRLTWQVTQRKQLLLECKYSRRWFGEEEMERLVEQLGRVIGEMSRSKEGERRLEELEVLSERERRQVVEEWNRTEVSYAGGERCVHELIEEQVKRTPAAVAVIYEEEELTYAELNRRANQLAHYLRQQGVGPEVRVGVCMERSVEMVVALLGVMKAGGAYVPMDPEYPRERLSYMLGDAQPPVVLCQQRFAGRLPEQKGTAVFCLDGKSEQEEMEKQSGENPVNLNGAESLVYVIYTSGSTGKPKGAMNVQGGLSNRLLWMQERYGLGSRDRVLQKTPYTFDVSVWEFFWPLLSGAGLVMARPGGHQDGEYLRETIQRYGITTMHFVPPMLSAWLEVEGVEGCGSLKRVICSGEALGAETARKFQQRLGAELHNLYGPTEASIDVSWWECRRDWDKDFVPIGQPIANTGLYVLDGGMKPVPVGVAGELYLGGRGLGRGYLARPELTAEKFVPNPLVGEESGRAGERLYRTGDLARWMEDGNIEFLGRLDHQVKVRGFRIELGEIETALSEQAGVEQAVVLAREDRPGEKRLVGYVVLGKAESETRPTIAELRECLQQRLPEYMVPALFVLLDEMPLTPNGKIDRKALPQPEVSVDQASYVAPRNSTEEILCGIWRQLLGLNRRISIHENFFELGGDSISSMRAATWAQEAGLNVSAREIFQCQTVAELAQLHARPRNEEADSSGSVLVPLRSKGTQPPLFFVHPAGGGIDFLWPLAHRIDPDRPVYGIRSAGFDDPEYDPEIEQLAVEYIEHIRAIQPRGPYFLGGYSLGAHIAFAMALQLSRKGEEVAMLAQIDAGPRVPLDANQNLIDFCHELTASYPELGPIADEVARVPYAGQLEYILKKVQTSLPEAISAQILRVAPAWYGNARAAERFMAKLFEDTQRYLYPGRITLFRARDREEIIAEGIATTNGNVTDPALSKGWSNFTSQPVELRWIPGTHETCIKEPNVKILARDLMATIEAHRASRATNKSRSSLPAKPDFRSYELNMSIWQIRDMEATSGDD